MKLRIDFRPSKFIDKLFITFYSRLLGSRTVQATLNLTKKILVDDVLKMIRP